VITDYEMTNKPYKNQGSIRFYISIGLLEFIYKRKFYETIRGNLWKQLM